MNSFVKDHGGIDKVTVFFRGQLLEVIRWACLFCQDQPDDGRTFENPEIRRIFAQVLLMAGDLWGQRVFGDRFLLKTVLR